MTVTAKDLAVFLHDLPALQLAVLNSCEGSRSGTMRPFAGTAQTLVRQARLPAVVAMQFEITDTAATDFARGFYSAIGAGFPVNAAVAEGRREILARGNRLEWGTPSLFMRSPDGRLFDLPEGERAITPAAVELGAIATGGMTAEVLALPADTGPDDIGPCRRQRPRSRKGPASARTTTSRLRWPPSTRTERSTTRSRRS